MGLGGIYSKNLPSSLFSKEGNRKGIFLNQQYSSNKNRKRDSLKYIPWTAMFLAFVIHSRVRCAYI